MLRLYFAAMSKIAASAHPAMSGNERAAARLAFARSALGDPTVELERASEDASFRSYWRARTNAGCAIVMDAPPQHEDLAPWLDIDARLRAAGLNSPQVLARDREQGFLLISDLGTRMYLPELNDASVDALYADALAALLAMQTRIDVAGMSHYDVPRLVAELELMPTWFLQWHLGATIECDEWGVIEAAFRLLVDSALAQPRAFVHRDYHSRNLLIVADSNPDIIAPGLLSPGIIDFQDAVVGPVTYDLVSLLRDCYIGWDDPRVRAWSETHRANLHHAGLLDAYIDASIWQRWFDLMGLQRHLKVLGIFCRLWYRDGKRGYLADLPRVWHYVRDIASHYPELTDFIALMENKVDGHDLSVPAS